MLMNTSSVLSSSLCRMDTTVSIQQQQQQQQQVVVLPPSCLSRFVGSTATTTTTTTTTTTGNEMLTLVGYSLLSVVALITVVFWAWIVLRFYYWYTSPLHNLPGEKKRRGIASFWCGVLPQICREGFMQAEQRWWKEAGPDVKLIHQPHWLGSSYVLVLDKDIVRTILTAPEGKRGQEPRFRTPRDTFRVFIGKGLLTLEGDEWRRHRRIIEPSFNGKLLEETLSASVPPIINQMVQLWGDAIAADPGREIDVNSHFSASTLDVLGNVTLSHDFGGIQAIRDWATSSANGSSSAQLGTLTDKFVTAVVGVVRFSIIGALCFVLEPPCYIQDCLIRMSTRLRQGRNKFKQEAENIVRNAKKKIALEAQAQAQAQAESERAASAASAAPPTTIQSSSRANCKHDGDGREEDPNDDSSSSSSSSTSTSRSRSNNHNHNNNNNNTRSILQLMLKAQQKDDDSDSNNNNNRGGNGQRTLKRPRLGCIGACLRWPRIPTCRKKSIKISWLIRCQQIKWRLALRKRPKCNTSMVFCKKSCVYTHRYHGYHASRRKPKHWRVKSYPKAHGCSFIATCCIAVPCTGMNLIRFYPSDGSM
jgi:Cytochrome P450